VFDFHSAFLGLTSKDAILSLVFVLLSMALSKVRYGGRLGCVRCDGCRAYLHSSRPSKTKSGPVFGLLIISLSQEPYVNAILAKFNFSDVKPVSIPLDPHIQLSEKQAPKTTSEVARMRNIPYRQAVGSLIHLASGTRPDIAFATSFVAQFCANPGWDHWEALGHRRQA